MTHILKSLWRSGDGQCCERMLRHQCTCVATHDLIDHFLWVPHVLTLRTFILSAQPDGVEVFWHWPGSIDSWLLDPFHFTHRAHLGCHPRNCDALASEDSSCDIVSECLSNISVTYFGMISVFHLYRNGVSQLFCQKLHMFDKQKHNSMDHRRWFFLCKCILEFAFLICLNIYFWKIVWFP